MNIQDMNIEDYIKFFCYKEGCFKLHSGEKSDYIFDILKVVDHNKFIKNFREFVKDEEYLVGIEFVGAILAALSNKPFGVIRKDGTWYNPIYHGKITIIDDVVTTENSLRLAKKTIEEKYYHKPIDKFVCVVDRRKVEDLKIKSMLRWKE